MRGVLRDATLGAGRQANQLIHKGLLNMPMLKILKTLAAAAAFVAIAPMAHAVQFNPLFTLTFDADSLSSNSQLTGASADVGFMFIDEGGDVRVRLRVANTTDQTNFGAGATRSKLTGVGLDLLDGVAFAGGFRTTGKFVNAFENASFQPFDPLDVAFTVNAKKKNKNQFNGGSSKNGLKQGESTLLSFLLDTELNAASLGDAYQQAFFFDDAVRAGLRFKAVNAGLGSDKLIYVGTPATNVVSNVPVPAALPLLTGGLAIFGLIGLRRRRPNLA